MKPSRVTSLPVILVVLSLSTAAFADETQPAQAVTSRAKTKSDKKKKQPVTEAAAPKAPDAPAPVPIETLPPVPASAPAPAPIVEVAPPSQADKAPPAKPSAETQDEGNSSTRIDALVGRTQTLGVEVGFRVGHRMANSTYIGGTAMAHIGVPGAAITYPALELGYDAKLGSARFMPFAGVGAMLFIPTGDSKADFDASPLVYPGFALRYENDKSPLTIGADVRFLYLTATDATAFAFNLSAGIRF